MIELHDVGLLFMIGDERVDNPQAILNISKLTNEVHKVLFSKEAEFLEAIFPSTLEYCHNLYSKSSCLSTLPRSALSSFSTAKKSANRISVISRPSHSLIPLASPSSSFLLSALWARVTYHGSHPLASATALAG